MPTFKEELAATTAALDALLKEMSPAAPVAKQLSAGEVVAHIAAELKAGNVTKERGEYLRSVLEQLAKNNFEATSFTPLREVNDPTLIKPETAPIAGLQALATGTPSTQYSSNPVPAASKPSGASGTQMPSSSGTATQFSSNPVTKQSLTLAQKAAIIQKLVTTPELITKGAYSDKLEELMDFFGISDTEMEDECELCWKVSDLVRALQQAVKLEAFVAKSGTTKSVEVLKPTAWPTDMASAKYDPVAKGYQREESVWGSDKSEARR